MAGRDACPTGLILASGFWILAPNSYVLTPETFDSEIRNPKLLILAAAYWILFTIHHQH